MTSFDFRAVYQAYLACRRRKRNTRNAQRYEIHLLDYLVNTQQCLQKRCWQPSRSVCFVTSGTKPREVHAASFVDRVVHHLVVPPLEVLFEPIFIHDSYANRKNKGTHKAVERLQLFMRQVTRNQTRSAYYLQLDIANFFNSIDKRILYRLLQNRLGKAVKNNQLSNEKGLLLRDLCKTLLLNDTARHAIQQGHPNRFAKVPPHKRLINAPKGVGLPIGDLTSQFFANVYLNQLDQYVKHHLKCRHYCRYVDDFILLHEDEKQLIQWRDDIENFLSEQLNLKLRDSGKLQPISNGADFLGYIVRPNYRLVRRRVIDNLQQRLQHFQKRLVKKHQQGEMLLLSRQDTQQLRATLASYLGHFKHANSWRLQQSLWKRYPFLNHIFKLEKFATLSVLNESPESRSFCQQWLYFKQHYPHGILFIQTGNHVETYNDDALQLKQIGYALNKTARTHFEQTISIPLKCFKSLRRHLRRNQIAHSFAAEQGYQKKIKHRVLRFQWQPNN